MTGKRKFYSKGGKISIIFDMKNLLKRLYVKFFLFLLCSTGSLFAAKSGLMSGAGNIKYIETDHFMVIYPEECRNSGLIIAENCEEILLSISADYDYYMKYKIPVTIVPATEQYNAYYSNGYRNHIVLFDTIPDQDMFVFSETLKSTFLHELNHYVSINNMSTRFQSFLHVLGDIWNVNYYISPTSFLAEGASVAQESKDGEGRLNDGFYLHTIRQTKLTGTFPEYTAVTGARDVYPRSVAYYFGGPFAAYLQETYGMEKYAFYWYTMINSLSLTYELGFSKVYGMTFSKAWDDFKKSIKVPEIESDVLKTEGVKSFLPYLKNNRGSVYSNISSCKNGFAYMDEISGNVYFCRKDGDEYSKPKFLFHKKYVQKISMSRDGRFLCVSFYEYNNGTARSKISMYDIKKNKFYDLNATGFRDGTVVEKDGGYYAAAVHTELYASYLEVYRFDLETKKYTLEYSYKCEREKIPYSLSSLGDGSFACLWKDGLDFSIRKYSFDDETLSYCEYALPQKNMRVRYLNTYSGEGKDYLTFSYAFSDTFPRFGLLTLDGQDDGDGNESGQFVLQDKDVSGGIYYSAFSGDKIIYSGFFYDNSMLLSYDYSVMQKSLYEAENGGKKTAAKKYNGESKLSRLPKNHEEIAAVCSSENLLDTVTSEFVKGVLEDEDKMEKSEITFTEKSWTKFYGGRGSVIPDFAVQIYSIGGESHVIPSVGYYMSNPWDSDKFSFSAGYNPFFNLYGFNVNFFGSDNAGLFEYTCSTTADFYKTDFLQVSNYAAFVKGFTAGRNSIFIFSLENLLVYGSNFDGVNFDFSFREYFAGNRFYLSGNVISKRMFADIAAGSVTYSNVRKTGPGDYEKAGISFGVSGACLFENELTEGKITNYFALSPEFSVYIPKIIPIDCITGFTYNFPVKLYGTVYNTQNTLFTGTADVLLCAFRIMDGFKNIPIFFNDLMFQLEYSAVGKKENDSFAIFNIADDFREFTSGSFVDSLTLFIMLDFGYNSGAITGYSLRQGVGLKYYLHNYSLEGQTSPWAFELNFSMAF